MVDLEQVNTEWVEIRLGLVEFSAIPFADKEWRDAMSVGFKNYLVK